MFNQLLLFMVLALASGVANAKVYKWVDQNGETHYSEKAPAEQKVSEVPISPAPALDNAGNNDQPNKIKRELESEIKASKANREAQENARAAQQAEIRKSKCMEARNRLEMYQQQVPIFTRDANNERVYLDDDTRAARIKMLTEGIAQNCAGL